MKYLIPILALVLPAMAGREFTAASSQLGVATIDAVSLPLTIAAFVRRPDNTTRVAFAFNTTTNATERVSLFWDGTLNVWTANSVNASAGAVNVSGVSTSSGTITHVAAVFTSTSSRSIFVNGANKVTETTANTADGFNNVVIGARKSTSFGAFWSGLVAEAAIWSVALTDAEIASLASGATPFMVRPASLVFYAPLTGRETATEWNYIGTPVSLTNSPADGTSHPRIYRP